MALEKVYSVTAGQLILETHVDLNNYDLPAAVFYPGAELNNDPTNWWGPNDKLVTAMLTTVGFKKVEKVHGYTYPASNQGRMVFHAYVDA
ncbi:MAG: hypothetical protein NC923_04465 [Candidatus Omnitrophica bacterium]|nr:hypothetical protein [Candidatus Omnitrophota bacterium]